MVYYLSKLLFMNRVVVLSVLICL